MVNKEVTKFCVLLYNIITSMFFTYLIPLVIDFLPSLNQQYYSTNPGKNPTQGIEKQRFCKMVILKAAVNTVIFFSQKCLLKIIEN